MWLTLPLLYGQGGSPMLLLSAMTLVWVADIAAYFTGRALGGRFIARKLAPSVSPNKSWEGALGGAAGTLLLAAVWVAADAAWGGQSLFTRLLQVFTLGKNKQGKTQALQVQEWLFVRKQQRKHEHWQQQQDEFDYGHSLHTSAQISAPRYKMPKPC